MASQSYQKFVIADAKGLAVLHVKLQKALSECLRVHCCFTKSSSKIFQLNPQSPCMANMTINENWMSVTWHVDDLQVSHKGSFEATKLAINLYKIYGKITVHHSKIHDYLGITMDYSMNGQVLVSMSDYTNKVLQDFLEEIKSNSMVPVADHLFNIKDLKEAHLLSEEQAVTFHHTIAPLLFLSAWARCNIQAMVAFLMTRVEVPNGEDWGILKRVLKYLQGTCHLKHTLTIDNSGIIKLFTNATFAIHTGCRN